MKKIALVVTFIIILGVGWLVIKQNSKLNKLLPRIDSQKTVTPSANPETPADGGETGSSDVTSSGPITLSVDQPIESAIFNTPSITVKGKTTPGASVFVNENEMKADSQGNFNVDVNLDEGENIIVVVANNDLGEFIEKEVIVNYEPEE